jgi:hypothetical protein
MPVLDTFPPLQAAIALAEYWKSYLNPSQDELCSPPAQDFVRRAKNAVGIGVQLGEMLPITWRATFHGRLRSTSASWHSVQEFETVRQEVRALFFTVRGAMDSARKAAEMLQTLTGRQPAGMGRLLQAIEEARALEENVFRDWPSFAEPYLPADSLSLEESLAKALGITVAEARLKLAARRHELNARSQ